jgi:hypothetical protein
MKPNFVTMIIGLVLLAFGVANAQTQSTELRSRIEQLRLSSTQASDLARNNDQSAANEDRLAQTGPSWARVVHQLAAVKFRSMANENRESARQFLTQAQELERQSGEDRARTLPPAVTLSSPVVSAKPSAGDDYLNVTDEPKVERAIESYLNRTGIKASTVAGNNGVVHFVLVGFVGANGQPNLQYKITALPPNSNGTEPRSQLIGITLETNVKTSGVGEPLYAALGEANKVGNCAWFVDGGEIKCRSWIGIPGPAYPVPAELVREKIRMINGEWMRFSPAMMTAAK